MKNFVLLTEIQRKVFSFCLGLLVFLNLSVDFAESSDSPKKITRIQDIPVEAKNILEKLPGKQLSVEVVVGRAMEYSADFKRVKSIRPSAEAAYYASRAALDWRLYTKGNYLKDEREAFSPLSFSDLTNTSYSVGLTTGFSSGTQLGLDLTHAKTEGNFQGQFAQFYETKTTFGITQQLWENALGSATRAKLESGEATREAQILNFEGDIEDWVIQMASIYYSAWLSQEQAKASDENLTRRERLAQIIRIRAKRGTSEIQDVLQIEGGVIASKADQTAAEQGLDEKWRGLVISLGFPETFLAIDPRIVPMSYLSPAEDGLKICKDSAGGFEVLKEKSPRVRAARKFAVAAESDLESSESSLKPTLELNINAMANGLDFFSRKTSFNENFGFKYPGYGVGLTLSLPLENSAEKAQFAASLSNAMRARAIKNQAEDNFKILWLNQCADLARLKTSTDEMWLAFQKQVERAKVEEKRFEIGRTSLQQVINAADDATRFRVSWAATMIQKNIAAWKTLQLAGQLKTKFENEISKIKVIQNEGTL